MKNLVEINVKHYYYFLYPGSLGVKHEPVAEGLNPLPSVHEIVTKTVELLIQPHPELVLDRNVTSTD